MKKQMSVAVESEYERDEQYFENRNTENIELEKVAAWIKGDQFDYGEWGRIELRPGSIRTEEDSRAKPNVFSSTIAVQTLHVLGGDAPEEEKKMCEWMTKLRDKKGYFLGAGGKKEPYGQPETDRVKNIRHTARGLDYLLRTGRFIDRKDAKVLRKILKAQNSKDGGFPQFFEEDSEIWSTSYFVNLMITLKGPRGVALLRKTPEESEAEIINEIEGKIRDAIQFLRKNKNKNKLWGRCKERYEATTTGVMIQIGPYLVEEWPEEYREIMYQLGKIPVKRRYTRLYLALIGMHLFRKEEQQRIFCALREDERRFEEVEKVDFVEVLAYGWIQKFGNNIGMLDYYNSLNHGHELVLPEELTGKDERKIQTEYMKWCLQQYREFQEYKKNIEIETAVNETAIIDKTKLWIFCQRLFQKYKFYIEEKGGWKDFWDGDKHVLEKETQNKFWSYADAFLDGHEIITNREKYTGCGMVDFEFSNGYQKSILVEFKLLSNRGLQSDGGLSQIQQYMVSTKTDTAFLVVFGFDEKDAEMVGKIEAAIKQFQMRETDKFIELVYIDASKKLSASKLYTV